MEHSFRRNPYVIGRPINEPDLFFGRKRLFQLIEDNLKRGTKVILLPGERRIGKSSLLKQIPHFVTLDEFVFVPFDLEYHNPEPLSVVLQSLSTEIMSCLNCLKPDLSAIALPKVTELETNIDIFADQFLPQIHQALDGKNLVLLLDEFDSFTEGDSQAAVKKFFPYLHSIINAQNALFIIICLGRNISDQEKLLKLFKRATSHKIGLLDDEEAKALITQPAREILKYSEEAIKAILELSGRHPYFIQIICFTIFGYLRNKKDWNVTSKDVENIIEQAIESAEGGLSWLWDGFSIPERVIFSSVAETQNQHPRQEPFKLLKYHGVEKTETFVKAEHQLANRDFLDEKKHQIKFELLRLWVVRHHPVYKEIGDLEQVEERKIKSIYEEATKLYQEDNKREAAKLFKQILSFNPNHFDSLLALAEGDLKDENFDKAVESYTRAYQFDPLRNKEKLLQAREAYAQKLFAAGDLKGAKEQYKEVLKIEPGRLYTKQKLQEIESEIRVYPPQPIVYQQKPTLSLVDKKQFMLSITAIMLGLITVVSVAIYRFSISCPAGDKKELGVFCIPDTSSNISKGERTFFPTVRNPNRDQGIKNFKHGKYADAAKFFTSAVKDAQNDPEVLIYLNNAKARQKGNPLTLAVVVPVDNAPSVAQEILRGVALSQNEFNNQDGLQGRLLEIAIANDGNLNLPKETDTAKLIAQTLIQDKSILGVIGHRTSEASAAALAEYEAANPKLALISPTSSSPDVKSKIFLRTVPSNATYGKTLAKYAIKSGLKKVAIISNEREVSKTLKDAFQSTFNKMGGQVFENVQPIDLNNNNLQMDAAKAYFSIIYRAKVQAVVLLPDTANIPQTLNILKANAGAIANPKNPKAPRLKLLGSSTFYSQETLTQARNLLEGLIIAVPWFGDAPQSKNFTQNATKQWGVMTSWRTATSFDATQAFIQAIKISPGSPSRETILQAQLQINLSPNETSGGSLRFNSEGERQIKPILIQVKGGKFTLVPSQ
jgi:ABC-type branched-subunit amino acid transport system substrate-binding protein